tara:strand:+ start:1252 stop:1515 length:264 start_codon:yes stop_codon:yes gene_type:complete
MPEKKESGLSGASASLRSAGCEILVTDLGKELASLEQDAVGPFRFWGALLFLYGGLFRGLEEALSRISNRGLASSLDQEMELIFLYI